MLSYVIIIDYPVRGSARLAIPPLTIKYCRIVSRPAEFDFGFVLFVVARLEMSFSASSYQNECGVWSGNLLNAMLARNMRKSSWQYFIVRGCSTRIVILIVLYHSSNILAIIMSNTITILFYYSNNAVLF